MIKVNTKQITDGEELPCNKSDIIYIERFSPRSWTDEAVIEVWYVEYL